LASGPLLTYSLDGDRNIGYLIHPSITNELSCSPAIADIGTGTGLFLSQLAKVYPEATLRGFDISRDLFPAPESLPSNVELGIMDVKQPPPPEEHNRYDVVHVRLLTAAMDPMDWDVAVRNLNRLLKPGGALQWEECNFADVQHLRGSTGSSVSAARFMGSLFREGLKEKLSHGWSTLPQIMGSAGLVRVDEDIVSSDRVVETREALTANGMVAIFGWAKLMSQRGMPRSCPMDELKRLEDQVHKDVKSGCYVRFDVHIALGFKPNSMNP
jgi:ubiquinone/menaquinone biosynthesis C-methylase UbiE